MAISTLPFYKDFFFIIENNEVLEWEAKKFVCKILVEDEQTAKENQKVYRGINAFVKNGFLLRKANPKNVRTFVYSETTKSKKL